MSFVDDLFSLKGKVAIVTGASSGIGRAMALALSRAGASVVHVARGEDELKAAVAEVLASGGQAAYAAGDVSRINALPGLVTASCAFFGPPTSWSTPPASIPARHGRRSRLKFGRIP